MASSTGQKWLIGCSVGCGVVVLVLAMLSAGTCFLVKGVVEDFTAVEESHGALVAAFGEADEFTPQMDGSIPPERVKTFLAVRMGLEESRERLHELFEGFPPDEGSGFWMFFKVVGGLAGMIDDIVAFVDSFNRELLANDMGYGEYFYIYSVAYYAWLGHDVADGPMHDGERIFDGDDSTFGVSESYRNYRRLMLAILRNQLESLPGDADDSVRARLLAEIDAFDRDRRHVAWSGVLPPAIESSLAPFRDQLEAAYDAETNCFELPNDERNAQGGFHLKID